mmetsp:Transcript_93278/g.216821  ORF Transcript_93278/g.216821 Transcript_93278/m.216821 type:complete len:209 (-) Transcript_93278:41-667(-)
MAQQPAKGRSETVVFNVSGKTFEVLREPTLAMYPCSILSQLAEDAEGNEAIFVQADPELFHYFLAFHFHQKIHIPMTVSKDAILLEARALNLPVKPEDVVLEAASLGSLRRLLLVAVQDAETDVAESVRATRLNLLRDLILEEIVKKIGTGQKDLSLLIGDLAKRAEVRVTSAVCEELGKKLKPWVEGRGLSVEVRCHWAFDGIVILS